MRINLLVLICTVFIVMAISQCNRNEPSRFDESKVVLGFWGDETIFFQDPLWSGAEYLMFLSFGKSDENGEFQFSLAERWEHSSDYREWTIFLHPGVKWHDGVPVTSADVKFTMDLRMIAAAGGKLPSDKAKILENRVKIIDELTLKITYENSRKPNEWSVYYPKHLLEHLDPKDYRKWEFWKSPVGNGPYRYVRHVPNTMVEVEANPDFFRGKPKIEKVILKFVKTSDTQELLSGNIDTTSGTGRETLRLLSGDNRYRFYHSFGENWVTIHWNHRRLLFESPKIRKALTLAINRRELMGLLDYPEDVPILDTITSPRQFRQRLFPKPLTYNPDQARSILDEAGWQDTNGDGVRDRNGKEFQFKIVTVAGFEKPAVFVQDQLKKIGVHMDIQYVPGRIMMQKYNDLSEIDAKLFFLINRIGPTSSGHAAMFGEKSPQGYSNPEVARLLNEAVATFDENERDRIYKKVMPIFAEDMPLTILYPEVWTSIAHQRIKGLSNPFRTDPVNNIEHLWIEEEK